VTITDANGCMVVGTASINMPDTLILYTSSTPESQGQDDGTASVTVGGGTPPYSYKWSDTKDQAFPTATGLSSGQYTVVVVDSNDCKDSATVNVDIIGGLHFIGKNPYIKLYPNPFATYTILHLNSPHYASFNLSIYDITGRAVRKYSNIDSKVLKIDKGNLEPGIYFIKLFNNGAILEIVELIIH